MGAFRLPKNARDASRPCLGESLGDGKYWGTAVSDGVVGSAAVERDPGDAERAGLSALFSDSWVTGRMVVPLTNGELEDDFGERGVRGLGPSELWASGVKGDVVFASFGSDLDELRSKLGTVEPLVGMLGVDRGESARPTKRVSWWLE